MLLLLVQSVFVPFRSIPLAGFESQPAKVEFGCETLLSGAFQSYADKKAAKSFGFREVMVRCYNQVMYSLFDETTREVIVGKDGYLFELGYRRSVCGQDFLGRDVIAAKTDSLRVINDWLHKQNKRLVVLITPNKWRTHADKVECNCPVPAATNYTVFKEAMQRSGIPFIDGIGMFNALEEESPHPLFSRQGTHWSVYGAFRAAQELRQTLDRLGIALPRMHVDTLEAGGPKYTDKDLHDLLNILRLPKEEALAYPRLSFSNGYRPRVLVVGDSYYGMFYYLGLHQHLFAPGSKFLYYNNSVAIDKQENRLQVTAEMKRKELQESEVVLLVMSEPSLAYFGFGFLREAAAVMAPPAGV